MNRMRIIANKNRRHLFQFLVLAALISCIAACHVLKNKPVIMLMKERQLSFSKKMHALDNNDNFSPDGNYLCYDTRGTVFDETIGNSQTIEKINISTGEETVLYHPHSIIGKQAAPGVGAVSWHPSENKVIFIHGPSIDEVAIRGYYDIRNRAGVEVSADGNENLTLVDMRDISTTGATTAGAHRGGTHRHEYSRNGKRIGFTYDDFLLPEFGRTIGYMEANEQAPEGYSHYFAVLVSPAKAGKSSPGEIEQAYGDSWVNAEGTKRAFIGKVRAADGVSYDTALFVAEIPETTNITSSYSGDKKTYPVPPKGIKIKRLTHQGWVGGIVRGSYDGFRIAYLSHDSTQINQVFVIPANGSDESADPEKQPRQLTRLRTGSSFFRWHPSNQWIFHISNGNIVATYAGEGSAFGQSFYLTYDKLKREELVVSPDGNCLAYSIVLSESKLKETKSERGYRQIFIMNLEWEKINSGI